MGCWQGYGKKYCFYVTSFVIIVLGIIITAVWSYLFNSILKSELALSTTSRAYGMWLETPIPMYFDIHLYNWTNSKEVVDSGWKVKPHFEECGPYVYIEKHFRKNLVWHDNGTITYHNMREWYFQPELSKGSLSDNITNLNVIATTMAYVVRNYGYLPQKVISFLLSEKEKTIAITRTADEWLYAGIDDEILQLVGKLNISGINLPFDKFGWFYKRNGSETYDGLFNIFTGQTDLSKLGMMDLWNQEPASEYYDSYCASINGSSGEIWPPIGNAKKIHIFSPDICSTMEMEYIDSEVYVEGMKGRQFIATADIFDNGTRLPDYKCFNVGDSLPSGVRNVSRCRFGAPAFISFPHFYLADPAYRENITGMHPNPDAHNFTMSLEPTTGVPLNVKAQLQINIYVQPLKYVKMFKDVKHTMFPMLWFRQTATMTDDLAGQIKLLLKVPDICQYTGYGLIGLGTLLFCVCLALTIRRAWPHSDQQPLLAAQSTQSL